MKEFLSPENVELWVSVPGLLLAGFMFAYFGAPAIVWTAFLLVAMAGFGASNTALLIVGAVCLIFILPPIRQILLSKPLMNLINKLGLLPAISETEKIAIDAGTVWVEKEFFTGKPNFNELLSQPYEKLSDEEQAFVDGPCQELCEMVHDWDIQCDGDLPKSAWDYIKKEGFFSFIIPKKYGGKEFSGLAVSSIVGKLTAASGPLGTTVMVPNSLGPAELLLHYGTEEQKNHYLPRLADGREIPCFALTEPTAGSDAGSITANGVVFKKDGEPYVRLNFNKRYITMAAISTVMGLAFKLSDPANILGKGEAPGITVALVPSNSDGVTLGRRHDPMGASFYNCPVNGNDVELPIKDFIIGGEAGAGNGWRMLMDCLSAGRAVTLPASSTGVAKLCYYAIGAYAKVRKQFGISIGKFEGVQEPMSRIGGYTYLLEAARVYTCGAVDKGEKPSVVSAIAKYHFTEIGRKIINDAMDISGGSGISRGPHNIFANHYISAPIGITVEGANILTRTMIVFGQGLIRCHPFVKGQVDALEAGDVKGFDKAFWSHQKFVIRNICRSVGLSLTRGFIAPQSGGFLARYKRKINWGSAVFATLADMIMVSYGGALKRKENITGRMGDMLSWMYMASCVMRRYEVEGQNVAHKDHAVWALEYCMQQYQKALQKVLQNVTVPGLTWLLRGPVRHFFRLNSFGNGATDRVGQRIAEDMMKADTTRKEMCLNTYETENEDKGIGRLNKAFLAECSTGDAQKKIMDGVRKKVIKKGTPQDILKDAQEKGLISAAEADMLVRTHKSSVNAIQVDSYKVEEYLKNKHPEALS